MNSARRPSSRLPCWQWLRCLLPLVAIGLSGASPLRADEPPEGQRPGLPSFDELLGRQAQVSADLLVEQAQRQRPPLDRLSFDPLECRYLDRIQAKLPLTDAQRELFRRQGFVSLREPRQLSFGTAYDQIYHRDLPVLITSDSILHALHRSFDRTLQDLEESVFAARLADVLAKTHEELARRAIAPDHPLFANYVDVDLYLTVSRSLLQGQPVESSLPQGDQVRAILAAIQALRLQDPLGGESTPLYGGRRAIDYSQFKPRGHYTRSPALQNYFRGLMWLGRADTGFFVLPADSRSGVQNDDARELRDAAILVDLLIGSGQCDQLERLNRCWERLVGISDNLRPTELRRLLERERLTLADLARTDSVRRLQQGLARAGFAPQQINSQVILGAKAGESEVPPPALFQVCGQRFVVDSFVLSKVVYDSVPKSPRHGFRLMPRGLDVIAALGNPDAIPLLASDLQRWEYAPHLAAAREFTAAYLAGPGGRSVYDLWLSALATLHQDMSREPFFPQAMQMPAWRHKQVHTQLASWAELRHDTILFAKQSYTKRPECDYPTGYVEPYPEFFSRMQRLAEGVVAALTDLERSEPLPAAYPGPSARPYWNRAAKTLQKLGDLARKELRGEEFTDDDRGFLKRTIEIHRRGEPDGCGGRLRNDIFTGWYADLLFPHASGWMKASPAVADVHTAPPAMLEVGVGDVHLAVIAIDNGTDRMAYVGPIYTYHEFIQPVSARLTDEEFESRLRSLEPPSRPDWVRSFEP
ncbi:MAG: DUF3160 domain-containing protein [Isosphaeraceae bacterium]|nr:DUF3160 domain-containing protein [Isosphaeraceae bacterium]